MSKPTPRKHVAICASSRLAPYVAVVADRERAKGHVVCTPDYTGADQPTDEQIERWHTVIINADEVVAVVGDDYRIGSHVRGELADAHMCGIPVRLVNGELEAK